MEALTQIEEWGKEQDPINEWLDYAKDYYEAEATDDTSFNFLNHSVNSSGGKMHKKMESQGAQVVYETMKFMTKWINLMHFASSTY